MPGRCSLSMEVDVDVVCPPSINIKASCSTFL